MEKFIQLNKGKVARFNCREVYDKEEVDKKSRGLSDDEMETTVVEGRLKVLSVDILNSSYSKESINISSYELERLSRYKTEIQAEKVRTTISEYYS